MNACTLAAEPGVPAAEVVLVAGVAPVVPAAAVVAPAGVAAVTAVCAATVCVSDCSMLLNNGVEAPTGNWPMLVELVLLDALEVDDVLPVPVSG
jgi:hypothetical protein